MRYRLSQRLIAEGLGTGMLVAAVVGSGRMGGPLRAADVPFAVAAYITAAYWFTASTSFANPAVTVARAFTDTFTGIRPADVPGFIAAQALGAAGSTWLFRWLVPNLPQDVT